MSGRHCENCGKKVNKAEMLCPYCNHVLGTWAGSAAPSNYVPPEPAPPKEKRRRMKKELAVNPVVVVMGFIIAAAIVLLLIRAYMVYVLGYRLTF
ncbi:hypothetical protein [Anaerolentibacter hominis]|uniref:hypothetical protein n=1 Tax=Anaerolentibacter hominis TaxID=3079009 RepID=UPI0031B82A31